jgi:hypothetical protein
VCTGRVHLRTGCQDARRLIATNTDSLPSGDGETDPSDSALNRERIQRLAGMVGSLSFGVWFRAIRHAVKAVESAGEDIGVLRSDTPDNFPLARAVGSTKPFQ